MSVRSYVPAAAFVCCMATAICAEAVDRPVVRVTADDTIISKSCRVTIPAGLVIEDANENGVIRIGASGIEIDFAPGSVLRGSPKGRRPDAYRGHGIRLNGHSNVAIRGARVSGYWCGLWATAADGLALEGVDASDNRRAFLGSTPAAEDGADWLHPHDNDGNEWLTGYGAGISIEDSDAVTVRSSRVHRGQNGLCLDRVNGSKIYDNDFSFNSGWGLALWRCCRNVISRNALDFCVRGYSHGVYNRGQDSAGLLMFEQNCENVIAENSITHGGDGIFGFSGREALGEVSEHPPNWYRRRGNADNLIVRNDCSYAAAHGIEMTFSFGVRLLGNRMAENAICGVWGGYSQGMLIAGNHFEGNGEMGYGLERGGVNIEHGKGNRILHNRFVSNRCGVHLWWADNKGLTEKPWARANGHQSTDNLLAGNEFAGDALAFHFRGPSDVTVGTNTMTKVARETVKDADSEVRHQAKEEPEPPIPTYPVYGTMRPVGARIPLRGRRNIIMTEWGPWDHASPLVRPVKQAGDSAVYHIHGLPYGSIRVGTHGEAIHSTLQEAEGPAGVASVTVKAKRPGVHPYVLVIKGSGDFKKEIRATLVAATWHATFFKWPLSTDPRRDPAGWRALASKPGAVRADVGQLAFKYGWAGPSEQKIAEAVTAATLGGDHFGMIARTEVPLTSGTWQFTTVSDDGVRVTTDGKPVIENWTWHGPTRDTGRIALAEDKTVEIVVEHFEIDGFAVLQLDLSRVGE